MSAYYNEHDPKAAAWLRELIAQGHIAPGEVDQRSITDVQPTELLPFTQCHFFAGIGGWSLALRLAGWPDDRPVWTGSCPCQPFSVAGKGRGTDDERHLWPVFARLIGACEPPVVFGEQVASKAGREWLAGVFADLEGVGYHRAGADLCAACLRAPHIRQRLFWVADAHGAGWQRTGPPQPAQRHGDPVIAGGGEDRGLGNTLLPRLEGHAGHEHNGNEPGRLHSLPAGHTAASGGAGGMANATGQRERPRKSRGDSAGGQLMAGAASRGDSQHDCATRGLEHATGDGREQRRTEARGRGASGGCGLDAWNDYDLIPCADGKARRIKPGLEPLAYGVPSRVGLLRGYGNAIIPQVAAEFIAAFLDSTS